MNETPQRHLEATEAMAVSMSEVVRLTAEQRDIALQERDDARADRKAADELSRKMLRHSRWALAGTWLAVAGAVVAILLGT